MIRKQGKPDENRRESEKERRNAGSAVATVSRDPFFILFGPHNNIMVERSQFYCLFAMLDDDFFFLLLFFFSRAELHICEEFKILFWFYASSFPSFFCFSYFVSLSASSLSSSPISRGGRG